MADPKPGTFTFTSRNAKEIMASRQVQGALDSAADRGIAAFKTEANKHRKTGELAARVHKEKARGFDGRPGVRIVATSQGNQSALFGTKRSKPVRASGAAMRAMKRKGR
ncbi:hypothetical protein [Williamsia sp.]|uniref:hypothetical protein n=1 Tax=Williamsia sp. TaxID=1872085 RepID=UPI002F928E3B